LSAARLAPPLPLQALRAGHRIDTAVGRVRILVSRRDQGSCPGERRACRHVQTL